MKLHDEYYWNSYTNIYSNQIITNPNIQFIIKNAYIESDIINWNGDNIHENIKYIMECILETKVNSVFECGFGGGQNIYSISKLFPNLIVGGVELLQSQIEFGIEYFKIPLKFYGANFIIGDWSIPNYYKEIKNKYEFLFTNAVIMHLNTEKAVSFIKNMMGLEPKYMLLLEGTPNHDWNELYELTGLLDQYILLDRPYKALLKK